MRIDGADHASLLSAMHRRSHPERGRKSGSAAYLACQVAQLAEASPLRAGEGGDDPRADRLWVTARVDYGPHHQEAMRHARLHGRALLSWGSSMLPLDRSLQMHSRTFN
jgi:hypothetical protein